MQCSLWLIIIVSVSQPIMLVCYICYKIRGVLISWISWWALTHEINTPRKYSKCLLLVRPNCPPTKITGNEIDPSPQITKLSSHELLPFYSIWLTSFSPSKPLYFISGGDFIYSSSDCSREYKGSSSGSLTPPRQKPHAFPDKIHT